MPNNKLVFDANAILRYILDDIPEQADIVEKIINERESLALPEVIAETVYILTKHYNIERKEAVENIIIFLNETNDKNEILRLALKIFSETNFDFVDCILYANSKQYDIFTFDKKLSGFIGRAFESRQVHLTS
ncbi:MAG: PIN domain-containing protein [Fibromonadaceae bacterium]|jgi:predicted nucleic acid-binding protein|nr:PIN domain-containing protein [Fibromonadaceae bacterium]